MIPHRLLLWLFATCAFLTLPAKVRVACVGNSITYGYGTANPLTDSYPAQLQILLGEDYEVGNFGLSGATLLTRGHKPYVHTDVFRRALAFRPDIVVIHLGVNDTDPRDWPHFRDDFIPDYIALIDSFRVAHPSCRIFLALLSPLGVHHPRFESGTRDWQSDIQAAIAQVARHNGVELIDFHTLLYAYPHLIRDSVHPDKEGLGMMAAYVKSVITGDFGGLRLPSIYGSQMVLPHGRCLSIQGTANAGSQVRVRLYGSSPVPSRGKGRRKTARSLLQEQTATVSVLGKWQVELQPVPPGGPYTMKVTDGQKTLTLEDVMAGEVWLCSGQSNMAFMLCEDCEARDVVSAASHPLLRLFDLKPRWPMNAATWPSSVLDSLNRLEFYQSRGWTPCMPQTAQYFSAVGYYFGRMLADSLQIPVGLVCHAVGGAGTEAFIDRKTLEHAFPAILRNWRDNDFLQDWVRARASRNLRATTDRLQRHPYEPCYLFESSEEIMGHFPFNGVIWYQGESNAHNAEAHARLFQLLLESWRTYYGNPDMPFYFVQLSSVPRPSWPWFRDSQRRLLQVTRHTGMAVSHDVGDSIDVHPRQKRPVGERLALLALSETYGFSCVPSGPLYKSMQQDGGRLVLDFDFGEGMKGRDTEPVRGFEVAGEDGIWHKADIRIKGSRVIVWSRDVPHPLRARYGWQPYTDANLVNCANLPASTFLTD